MQIFLVAAFDERTTRNVSLKNMLRLNRLQITSVRDAVWGDLSPSL